MSESKFTYVSLSLEVASEHFHTEIKSKVYSKKPDLDLLKCFSVHLIKEADEFVLQIWGVYFAPDRIVVPLENGI